MLGFVYFQNIQKILLSIIFAYLKFGHTRNLLSRFNRNSNRSKYLLETLLTANKK